jgi:DNA-binding NarL/FixJ family response regulator
MTTILLIDGYDQDRTYYADHLKHALSDCVILEAKDGQTGLDLYHSRRVDCCVTELQLGDMSGFNLLVQLVPRASQPAVAIVMLTRSSIPALGDIAKSNGAQAFLVKRLTTGEDLASVIEKAIAVVGPRHKDHRGSLQMEGNPGFS